jgi:lysophospholipase L1-like esterase
MRRQIVTIIGIVLLAGAIIGPLAYASATVGETPPHSSTDANASVTTVKAAAPLGLTGNATGVQTQQPGYGYVAIGDSIAAGAGLPALAGATSEDELCDRSSQAYPYRIAEQLQVPITHAACSGAKVDEGIYGQQTIADTKIPRQLDVAFSQGKPEVMTVTVGANDVRWTQFVRQCYVTRCGFAVDDARMKLYRADLRVELTRMLAEIQVKSHGSPPQVYLGGYYSPVASTECISGDRITSAEVDWINRQTANLNQAIRSVAPLFSFAHYVPVDFTNHEICAVDPWVQGMDTEAPIHPTANGQTAIAEAFLQVMR